MPSPDLHHRFKRLIERESLSPDFGRGMRCMLSYMVPLALALTGKLPFAVVFAAIAAQSIANVDVRGPYVLRFTLLLAMSAVLAGSAALGALMGAPLAVALLATVAVAAGTGLWRHLSSDYGPSLAVSSSLMFFIALALPGGLTAASDHLLAGLAGGFWGVLLQVALWPIRPQHPLRAAVADSWLAAADLFSAMNAGQAGLAQRSEAKTNSSQRREAETDLSRRSETEPDGPAPGRPPGLQDPPAEGPGNARQAKIAEAETVLRSTLDKAYEVLSASAAARSSVLVSRLEHLNLAGARLAMRVSAFYSAQEVLVTEPDFGGIAPSFLPICTALNNTARSVALAVVSRQPGHLAAVEVRLQRLTNLLRVLRARLEAQTDGSPAWTQLGDILRQIEEHLPTIGTALRATIDRADERAAFSLELLDLQTVTLRPLAAALNFSRRVDPLLVRYTLRIATLTLIGVIVFKTHRLPHGYWLPFTMVVVLQPDYGATRRKAMQRLLGTFGGSVLASLLLWLHPPLAAVMVATAATAFLFGYYLKRDYGVAVIFITLFVVLLTEANGPVTIALTAERLGATIAGGSLALLAALLFWPVWERDRFRPFLAAALRENGRYLLLVLARLAAGGAYDRDVIQAKRRAETANTQVFSSLQRMIGDPKNRQDRLEQVAALANGNQRLTRGLNLLALHLTPGAPLPQPELEQFALRAADALEALAAAIDHPAPGQPALTAARKALDNLRLPTAADAGTDAGTGPRHQHWVFAQLSRATTELSAMLLAAE